MTEGGVTEWRSFSTVDVCAALVVGSYIMYSGYRIGMDNLDYLMGSSPDPELIERIRQAAGQTDGIHGVNVNGGLMADNLLIDDISDCGINGESLTPTNVFDNATTWNGLTISNSMITDTNRYYIAVNHLQRRSKPSHRDKRISVLL